MLPVDRLEISNFMYTLFRHAYRGYIQFRAFGDNWSTDFPYAKIPEWQEAVNIATNYAQRCANATQNVVFCPPIATFSHPRSGKEKDLALGLALSAECDINPTEAQTKLESILGPPTILVASGGTTDTNENKLHLHWRLIEPTSTQEQHNLLKTARKQLTKLVQADRTNVPLVHPIRWPGSWHKKATPRMTRILNITHNEIDLATTITTLNNIVGETQPQNHQQGEFKEADDITPYGWGALVSACSNIREAPQGQRHYTLNNECFAIGTLAAAGEIPYQFALTTLEAATKEMQTFQRDNFNLNHALHTMRRALKDGYARPRHLELDSEESLEENTNYE